MHFSLLPSSLSFGVFKTKRLCGSVIYCRYATFTADMPHLLQICHIYCRYATFTADMLHLLQIYHIYCRYATFTADMPYLLQICHIYCRYATFLIQLIIHNLNNLIIWCDDTSMIIFLLLIFPQLILCYFMSHRFEFIH